VAGWVLTAAFFAGFGFRCVKHGWYEPPDPAKSEEDNRRRKYRGSDFTAYYSAGELVLKGKDLHAWTESSTPFRPFIYPPMFALFPAAPLALLPHNAALIAYYLLNVGLLLASLWLLRRMLWPPAGLPAARGTPAGGAPAAPDWGFLGRPEAGLFFALLVCWRFFDSNFMLGNANVIILFLIALSLYALHRERDGWSGLALALATSFKVTPGLLGLYFLWTRRGWALLGGALGLLLFLLVLPGATLGWSYNWKTLESFAGQARGKLEAPAQGDEDGKSDAEDTRAYGISLRGTLLKLLSPTVSLPHRPASGKRSINVLDLDPATTTRLADAAAVLLLAATVWLTWRRAGVRPALPLALSWGLVIIAMLLVSPHTRKAHGTILLIPAAGLVAALQQGLLTGGARRLAGCALLVLGVATLLTAEGVIGQRASETAHAAGAATWAMAFLYIAVGVALWQISRRGEAAASVNPEP
jgi:hypothetical protein